MNFFIQALKWLVVLASLALLVMLIARIAVIQYSRSRLFTTETAPPASAALVFGAGLRRDGTPTTVLRDRVDTAAALYRAGKVQKLLFSGDNRFLNYNEPESMRQYALGLGIPDEAIVLDYAGRRTYDSCYRASAIFGLKDALLVTQPFHLPRAVFTCNQLGLSAQGVKASVSSFSRRLLLIWHIREIPASAMAVWEAVITQPLPVLGEPEPIFPPDNLP